MLVKKGGEYFQAPNGESGSNVADLVDPMEPEWI